jgi:hypothetical protein
MAIMHLGGVCPTQVIASSAKARVLEVEHADDDVDHRLGRGVR